MPEKYHFDDSYETIYAYNSLDMVTNINYNSGKEVNYAYNAVGDLVKMTDWTGTTSFEADLLSRITKTTDAKGTMAIMACVGKEAATVAINSLLYQLHSGVLRSVMAEQVPIRDASPYPMQNAGFLGLERLFLQTHGWRYVDGFWYPPTE